MTAARRANLARLLRPRHIAFIGGASAAFAADVCAAGGFTGPIWGVNPKRERLGGQPCFPSVAALPEPPDAVFLAVPRAEVVETVGALARRGAGGVVCYSAGFAETGNAGAALERDLVAAAGELAFIGPNCLGMLNYVRRALLWPFDHGGRPVERGVAFLSQSGMLCTNLSMNRRALDFACLVSIGNQAVIAIEDLIEALLDDPAISAIGLYIEGLKDVARFAEVAARALERGVPIVALKAGRSTAGARVAATHTASLAGSDTLYQALFERLGVVPADSPTALIERLKLLSVAGAPRGRRVFAFTCSGGDAAMLADYGERHGLTFPAPTEPVAKGLRDKLPDIATVANPLDYTTPLWGQEAALEAVIATALTDAPDVALMVQDHPRPELGGTNEHYRADTRAFIRATRAAGIPAAVCSSLAENIDEETRDLLVAGGVAPLQGLDEAVAAVAAAADFAARRAATQGRDLRLAPVRRPAGRPVTLDEWQGKQRLAMAGLAVPEGRLVAGEDAPAAARALGFPVALKLVSPSLPHKTEAGAVRLGLADEAAVAAAVAAMRRSPAVRVAGAAEAPFLVERMVADTVAELLVGISHDPQFGHVLTLGSGGVLVELVRDAVSLLLPIGRADIEQALDRLKAAALIAGYRGRPVGDRASAVDAILAVAAFAAADGDRLHDLDINPLAVRPRGAVALDVLLRVSDAG
jgi:acyl-CoA synthetase (NDP forming)